jgi:hypothetical protein
LSIYSQFTTYIRVGGAVFGVELFVGSLPKGVIGFGMGYCMVGLGTAECARDHGFFGGGDETGFEAIAGGCSRFGVNGVLFVSEVDCYVAVFELLCEAVLVAEG